MVQTGVAFAPSFIGWVMLSESEFAHVHKGVPGPAQTIKGDTDVRTQVSLWLVACVQ